MSKQIEALKLALEGLEYIHEGANNQGPHTGISWRCVSNKAEPAITAIREALADSALERMAENARELGLDYEPPCKTGSQCTSKCQQCEQPAQHQPNIESYLEKDNLQPAQQQVPSIIQMLGHCPECGAKAHHFTSPQPSKPWVGLTREDGVVQERQRIVNLLMIQHEMAKGAHNYWHVAAQLIQADVASDT